MIIINLNDHYVIEFQGKTYTRTGKQIAEAIQVIEELDQCFPKQIKEKENDDASEVS